METVIFGAGRQGRVVLEVLRAQGLHQVIGFLDDDASRHGTLVDGVRVLGGLEWAAAAVSAGIRVPAQAGADRPRPAAIVAIGGNDARTAIAAQLRALGFDLINAIHPSAVVQGNVSLGAGDLVCAGAILVTGTRLEDDVVVNTGAIIDHDGLLECGAQVASGVTTSGCVTIRRGAFVGAGTILGPSVTVGEDAIIGAGALVLRDVPPRVLAHGAPCRVIREITEPVNWARILAGQGALRGER
jgi:sugar O-acyltransferase (sialic acid O-acetyltransferase NeuD family)